MKDDEVYEGFYGVMKLMYVYFPGNIHRAAGVIKVDRIISTTRVTAQLFPLLASQ
jgi:hypothetical protein